MGSRPTPYFPTSYAQSVDKRVEEGHAMLGRQTDHEEGFRTTGVEMY